MELSEDSQKVGTQSVVRLVGVDSVCVCFFFKVGFTTVDDETLGEHGSTLVVSEEYLRE